MEQNSVFGKNTFNISPEIQQMALEQEFLIEDGKIILRKREE